MKSRFALYSVRGAVFAARVEVRLEVVLALRFAAFAVALVPSLAFFVALLTLRLALFEGLRFDADFVARAGRVLLVVRLVAMHCRFAKNMPPSLGPRR